MGGVPNLGLKGKGLSRLLKKVLVGGIKKSVQPVGAGDEWERSANQPDFYEVGT